MEATQERSPDMKITCWAGAYARMFTFLDEGLILLKPYYDGREGGVFSVFEPGLDNPNRPILQGMVGYIPPKKISEKYRFSVEKGVRLLSNPQHWTSRQSRNEEKQQWTGAVRGEGGEVLSFSGMPEAVDEALMLFVLVKVGFLELHRALEIADTNPEDVFRTACYPALQSA